MTDTEEFQSNDIVVQCLQDIVTKTTDIEVEALAQGKVFHVYSEQDLSNKVKMLKYPCVGVMYEGLAPKEDGSNKGLSNTLTVAVALLMQGKMVGNFDSKNQAAVLLAKMRDKIKKTSAPAGHPWRWAGEVSGGRLGEANVYIQRWTTTVMISA